MSALRRKMEAYQANGARLGWLLLPEQRAVEIWRGGEPGMAQRLEDAARLDGGELAEGLALELEARPLPSVVNPRVLAYPAPSPTRYTRTS